MDGTLQELDGGKWMAEKIIYQTSNCILVEVYKISNRAGRRCHEVFKQPFFNHNSKQKIADKMMKLNHFLSALLINSQL